MKRIKGTIADAMKTAYLLDDSLLWGIEYRWGEAIKRGNKEHEKHYNWLAHAVVKLMKKVGAIHV